MNKVYRFFLSLTSLSLLLCPLLAHGQYSAVPFAVTRVKEFTESSARSVVVYNEKAYFIAADINYGTELWQSDGTGSGTTIVKNIHSNGSSNPGNFYEFNGLLYFSAGDNSHGIELWRTDGTSSGTTMVKDINPAGNSYPSRFMALNNTLFFFADNGTTHTELWKTDGTAAGTVLVKDIRPGPLSAIDSPSRIVALTNKVYFTASDGINGSELWCSDGTTAGTQMVVDLTPNSTNWGSEPKDLVVLNGILYFTALIADYGRELWRSNGTAGGTYLVKDIWPGPGNDNDIRMIGMGQNLYFSARSSDASGDELWKSDGTLAGTVMVRNINPQGDASPKNFAVLNGELYFGADNGQGDGLWKTDGTNGGTVKLKSTSTDNLAAVGNALFFAAPPTGSETDNDELWRSDGTAAGTKLLKDINTTRGSNPRSFKKIGNTVFFWAAGTSPQGVDQSYSLYKYAPCPTCGNVPVPARLGADEPTAGLRVTVLKNPVQETLTVQISGAAGREVVLQLSNLMGQSIESRRIEISQAIEHQRFTVKSLPAGILVLRATSEDQQHTVRIAKFD